MSQEEKRVVRIHISSTGQKLSVQSPTLTQNATNAWIYLYTEKRYVNIDCSFRGVDGKHSPTYHLIYVGRVEDDDSEIEKTDCFKYILNIPAPVLSFVIPAPTAKISVGFECYSDDDGNGYLRTTTVASTQLTVNRSDNSQVIDSSYNATDVNNLWNYVGQLSIRLDKLEETVNVTLAQAIAALDKRVSDLEKKG